MYERPNVSIIIVTYNNEDIIDNCISSIVEKTTEILYEIIIIDNNSKDKTRTKITNNFSFVKLISLKENVGFGKANNIGFKESKGEFILFLNPDIILINNAVKILYYFLQKNNQVGLCGGNLYKLNGDANESYSIQLPNFKREIKLIFNINALGKDYFNYGEPKKVGFITGADMMISSDLFKKINGYDERFFMYYEDPDICRRVINKGYLIYSVPEAKIIHLQGESSKINPLVSYINIDSQLRYAKKWNPFLFAVLFFFRIIKGSIGYIKYIMSTKKSQKKYWSKYLYITIHSLFKQRFYFK